MTFRRSRWIIGAALLLAVAAAWLLRWQIGTGAFRIIEPAVRSWAEDEVTRLSDSVYVLSLSPIRVATDQRRVTFDSVRLTTVAAVNARRDRPLPALDLMLHGCAVEGLDANRLAAGDGLRAERAGCDSALATIRVPFNVARDTTEGSNFLSLRDTLRLPESVPTFAIEMIRMPNVRLDLRIEQRDGEESALAFHRLAVEFDSVGWDPQVPPSERPTLLSRDVVIRLTDAEGSSGSDHATLAGLHASLADSTLELRDLAWTPVLEARADSLGVAGLAVDTMRLAGVDWESALVGGNVLLRTVVIAAVRLTTTPGRRGTDPGDSPSAPWTLERSLSALHRTVRIDTARIGMLEIRHGGRDATTSARWLHVTGLRFTPGDTVTPVPPLRFDAAGLVHAWSDYRATVDTLHVDLTTGTLDAHGISHGTTGTDGQFAARRQWRTDRITVDASRLRVRGFDGNQWGRSGRYRAHSLAIDGLHLDVFSDKQLPPRPEPSRHRSPQGWLRAAPLSLRIDTIAVQGTVGYRERGGESGMIGEIRFEELNAGLADFATGTGTAARPIRLLATARLMGTAPFQLQAELPRTPGFELAWSGRLGAMPAASLNPMLIAVSEFAFEKGEIDWIEFNADTHDGYSQGIVRPRYRGLDVAVPGMARSGPLGGVRRAIAGVVANAFVVRGDNRGGGDQPAHDGQIAHGWDPSETLIQHLWVALREGLKQVVLP